MTRLALDEFIGAASPSLLGGRGIEALAAYRAALGS